MNTRSNLSNDKRLMLNLQAVTNTWQELCLHIQSFSEAIPPGMMRVEQFKFRQCCHMLHKPDSRWKHMKWFSLSLRIHTPIQEWACFHCSWIGLVKIIVSLWSLLSISKLFMDYYTKHDDTCSKYCTMLLIHAVRCLQRTVVMHVNLWQRFCSVHTCLSQPDKALHSKLQFTTSQLTRPLLFVYYNKQRPWHWHTSTQIYTCTLHTSFKLHTGCCSNGLYWLCIEGVVYGQSAMLARPAVYIMRSPRALFIQDREQTLLTVRLGLGLVVGRYMPASLSIIKTSQSMAVPYGVLGCVKLYVSSAMLKSPGS